ncbi:MAG: DUF4249 domain-containing protein [Bacteroidales bacterium]
MVISLCSCEKIIEYNGETTISKPTVFGLLYTFNKATIYLGQSTFFLNDDSLTVDSEFANADVKLVVNGESIHQMKHIDGDYNNSDVLEKYQCEYIPGENDSISLSVKIPGYDELNSSMIMPGKADFELISKEITKVYDEDTDTYSKEVKLKIRITSHGDNVHCYYLNLLRTYDNGIYLNNECYASSNDILFKNNENTISSFSFRNSSNYFNDQLFRNQDYEFEIDLSCPGYRNKLDKRLIFVEDDVLLSIMSITEDYYNYLQSLDIYQQYEINDMFSEKTKIFSNIDNGIGIFGGLTDNGISVNLREK